MAGKSKQGRLLILAAFIPITLATLLLLVVSIQFFSSAEVWMHLNAWAKQISPSAIVLRFARMALPQPSAVSPMPIAALRSGPTPTPFQPLAHDQAELQPDGEPQATPTQVGPTPVPVYEVVEEQPPEGSLVIPSLDIDQHLTPVAVREQEWDLSALGSQVGWLQTTGTHPGDDLAMVLIGHITLPPPGGPGPFLNLSALQPGDIVEYRTGQAVYEYLVLEQTVVNPDMVDSLYRRDGGTLLLITCTSYNALERKYDQRLLVEAVLVNVKY